jgi:Zn-dependent protease
MGFFKTSKKEIVDLLKAWIAISLIFAIALNKIEFSFEFLRLVIIAMSTAGIGFLLHELAHKVVAQRYGCFAEFRSFDKMLLFALLISFTGFIFAAPGGVFIQGFVGKVRNGKISAAGIVMNIILAIIFFLVGIFTQFKVVSYYGLLINAWLALFNLIPIGNFDGVKIIRWDKKVYYTLIGVSLVLVVFG